MRQKVTDNGPCPHCGFDNRTYVSAPNHLFPLTPLNGRYVIGKVIGSGGFGITYKAYDNQLRIVVAIKELFLKDICSRGLGQSVTVPAKEQDFFEESKKKFLQEARVLAMFNSKGEDVVVDVKEHFEENNTAYIVMEYLDGITLKEMVKKRGRLSFKETKELLAPVCRALSQIHKLGVIHKDVSPDNIILLHSGGIKLLDFGGATSLYMRNKGFVVSFKRGYAPVEQYSEKGNIGTWTDIYAMAATFYYCITGTKPTDAMERKAGKDLTPPTRLGADISARMERHLLKAMDMDYRKRYQTMDEFWVDMEEPKKNHIPAIIISVVAVAALIAGIVFLVHQHNKPDNGNGAGAVTTTPDVSAQGTGNAPASSETDTPAEETGSVQYALGQFVSDLSGSKAVCSVYQKYGKYYLTAVQDSDGMYLQMWREDEPNSSQKFEFVSEGDGKYRIYFNAASGKIAWQWDQEKQRVVLTAPNNSDLQLFHVSYDGDSEEGLQRFKIWTFDKSAIVNLDDSAKKDIDVEPVKTRTQDDKRRSHEDMYLE